MLYQNVYQFDYKKCYYSYYCFLFVYLVFVSTLLYLWHYDFYGYWVTFKQFSNQYNNILIKIVKY